MNPRFNRSRITFSNLRFNIFYSLLILVLAIFVLRLFYIQVLQHQNYKEAALSTQLKEYEIPAERGVIQAHDGSGVVPIVLNEEVYTLFADPNYVTDIKGTAEKLAAITKADAKDYEIKMAQDTRYSVLAKKLDNKNKQAIESLDIKGIGLRAESIRTYPQGNLAAQLLGFVNNEGVGNYGVEQFLDKKLHGQSGQLKAITDLKGVPLVANRDNILKDAVPGDRITLTIDIGMQKKAENILDQHLKSLSAKSGSVIIIDPNNGAIKAMANLPSYNPAEFNKVKDPSVFTNDAVSSPLEVGSIMKTLTVSAGLNEGVISKNTEFNDSARAEIDGAVVTNVGEGGSPGRRSISDILRLSLNTGAIYILKQLGGGEINDKGRKVWHDYLVNHYFFGQKTGIEQGYEAEGVVPGSSEGFGLNIRYANMAFGQGLTITPLQFAAAFAATVNGGDYYQPYLVEPDNGQAAKPKKKEVIKKSVSADTRALHQRSVDTHFLSLRRDGYKIGGKTGTPQIASPAGGYYSDRFNGTFIGYLGGDRPQYVIMIRVDEPKVATYAGFEAAAPLFGKIVDMLIGNFSVPRVSR